MINKFGDDENNALTKTVLLMKIGGGNKGIGIHGTHLGVGVHIRYGHSDAQRQTIPWIEYNGPGGKTVYRADGRGGGRQGLDHPRNGLHGLPQPARRIVSSCRIGPWTKPCSPAISRRPCHSPTRRA